MNVGNICFYIHAVMQEVREQSPASPGKRRTLPASSLLCAKKTPKKKLSHCSPYKRGEHGSQS
jgi:hypothetical protein